MLQWWGPVIYELYGGTEGCGQTYISPQEWLRKKGSVGRPAPGCQIRIVDEHSRTLGANQIGLIYMGNGRRFEYYKDPQKTAEAHDATGLATMGDIGYLDEDGYLFLTDRRAYTIISGGVNIYPQEAENVLCTHPAVADVAVIGIPHPDLGEEVKAVVQAKDPCADLKNLAAELLAFCRERLSGYKCPRSVDFVSELPRNEAGKLMKRLVKARYWPH
jgi:long-chain acyl-CoA synthetase